MSRTLSILTAFALSVSLVYGAAAQTEETSPSPSPSECIPNPPMENCASEECDSGYYWDGMQCVPSPSPSPSDSSPSPFESESTFTSMPPPSECAPGEYWDHNQGACMSGTMAPPDGSGGCRPMDPQCAPPPECREKMDGLRSEFEALFKEFEGAMRSFHEEFEEARRAYGESQHTPEEWRAWGEEYRLKSEQLGKSLKERLDAFGESHGVSACIQYLMLPPIMGGPMGGPGGDQGPRNYEQMRQPPQGNRFQEEDDEVRKIRSECESQAKEILGEYWHEPGQGPGPMGPGGGSTRPSENYQGPPPPGGQYPGGSPPPDGQYPPPPDGSYPGGSPPPGGQYPGGQYPGSGDRQGPMGGPSREQMEKVHEIMRECEKKIRAHFEELYKEERFDEGGENAFGSFEMYFDEEAGEIHVTGKYLALVGNPESQVMSEVTCGGQSFIDELYVDGYLENFDFEQSGQGTALHVRSEGSSILMIHDNPRCVINLATGGSIAEITLDLADYLELEEVGNGVSFTDGEVDGKILLHDGDLDLEDGNVIVLHSKATFLVSNGAGAQAGGNSLAKDLNFQKAIEDGNIGGEILIVGDGDEFKSDETPYGDLDMNVTQEDDETIVIDLEKEESDGKTIVVSIDEEVLTVNDLDDVEVSVSALVEGATDGEEAEISCVQEASDLQDVLDPNDDGDCHEWWVVLDKNGVQVLISIPHFSGKHIEIQSVGGGDGGLPSLGIFGATAAAVSALVLVGAGLRRRK